MSQADGVKVGKLAGTGIPVTHLAVCQDKDGRYGTSGTYLMPKCGCRVVGGGVLPDPLAVALCATHASAPSALLALRFLLTLFREIDCGEHDGHVALVAADAVLAGKVAADGGKVVVALKAAEVALAHGQDHMCDGDKDCFWSAPLRAVREAMDEVGVR